MAVEPVSAVGVAGTLVSVGTAVGAASVTVGAGMVAVAGAGGVAGAAPESQAASSTSNAPARMVHRAERKSDKGHTTGRFSCSAAGKRSGPGARPGPLPVGGRALSPGGLSGNDG